MLNFEEELKKFEPSPDIDASDDAVYTHDLRDVMDIVQELMERENGSSNTAGGSGPQNK